MKIFKVISLGVAWTVLSAVGCGNSKVAGNADGGFGSGGRGGTSPAATGGRGGMGGGAAGPDGGVGGAGGSLVEFTDFVNDLIVNKTSATNRPETITDKAFKDSMNPAAFDPLFK